MRALVRTAYRFAVKVTTRSVISSPSITARLTAYAVPTRFASTRQYQEAPAVGTLNTSKAILGELFCAAGRVFGWDHHGAKYRGRRGTARSMEANLRFVTSSMPINTSARFAGICAPDANTLHNLRGAVTASETIVRRIGFALCGIDNSGIDFIAAALHNLTPVGNPAPPSPAGAITDECVQ